MFEKDLKRLECSNTRREFIARVFDGDTISEACAMMRLNPAALGLTMRDDPSFANEVRQAQAFRVDIMVDKLENIQEYESDSFMAGVISKNIQWLASKRLRQIYGDKLDVNHTHTINIKDAMEAARNRALIDVTPNMLIDNVNATDSASVAQPVVIDAEAEIDPLS